jgi:hypothetical protein
LLLRAEGFLCFSLYFFDIGFGQFVLMLLEVHIKLLLGFEMLVADVALYESTDCYRLSYFYLAYRLFADHTHNLNNSSLAQYKHTLPLI